MLVGAHLSQQQGPHIVTEPRSELWVACKADVFETYVGREGTLSII